MREIIPVPYSSFGFNEISIIPRLEKISVNDPELSLKTRLTRNLTIDAPFVASPMDSVMDYRMACCMSRHGLIPIFCICKNNNQKVQNEIIKFMSTNHSKFGILIPTSVDFVRAQLDKDILYSSSVIAIDTLHSAPYNHLKVLEYLRNEFREKEIISGNVTNGCDCETVISCGVDAVRVGMTSNTVNHGYELTGCGRQQAKSVFECAAIADKYGIPIIADGGVKDISDLAKCISLGASSVMMGGMFAAIEESPSPIQEIAGKKYKKYQGMSRADVIDDDMLPEGSTVLLEKKGLFDEVINEWMAILKIAVVRSGVTSVEDMRVNSIMEYYNCQ